MGFLKRLFGKTESEKVTLDMSHSSAYARDQRKKDWEHLEQRVFARMTELRHEITVLHRRIARLEQQDPEAEQGNPRLRKIVKTTKTNLTRQMKGVAEHLTPPQTDQLSEIHRFTVEGEKWLGNELSTFRKNFAYSGAVLKEEVKEVGGSVREMVRILSDTRKEIEESGMHEMEQLVSQFREWEAKGSAVREQVQSIEALSRQQEKVREEQDNCREKLAALQVSPDARRLKEAGERKKKLQSSREEVIRAFNEQMGKVEKPLKRFLNYTAAGHFPLKEEERKTLEAYLSDPLSATRQDVKGEVLKKMLVQMRTLLEEGKLLVKDKQREKAFAAIEELREYDFYGNVFWKLNQLEVQGKEVEKELKHIPLHAKTRELEQRLEMLEMEWENTEKVRKKQVSTKQVLENEQAHIREEYHALLEKITGKKINLTG